MWHNRETCVEVKQSRDMSMAIRCTDEELDHFASVVKWFSTKYLRVS